jgi:hypothetical protein
MSSICNIWIHVEQSVVPFDTGERGRSKPAECCSNQTNRRVFLSKLERESTRKGATCKTKLTCTRFSKKCLEYSVRVNVT